MGTRYAVIPLLACSMLQTKAQPTLPPGHSNFTPGDHLIVHQGVWFAPPPHGEENTTWDHSGFQGVNTFTSQWVAPSGSTPNGTTVVEEVGTTRVFYRGSPAAFEQLGLSTPTSSLTCSDAVTILAYPITYGSDFNDTYECTGVTSGEAFTRRNGTVEIKGASWGTLVLPFGTFPNVLMVYVEQRHEEVFTSDGSSAVYRAFTQLFYRPGVKAPLLGNYENYYLPGPLRLYAQMIDASLVGMEEAMRHDIGVDLVPNPATDRVEVLFGVSGGSRLTIEVVDLAGKVVAVRHRPSMHSGVQREVIDLGGLPAGAYSVRVTDQNGAFGAKRLIVQ